MKRLLLLFSAWMFLLSCTQGADDKENLVAENSGHEVAVWDFSNYAVAFEVVDKVTGADLLDPATEGNILGGVIRAVYRDRVYDRLTVDDLQYDLEIDTTMTKAMMALPCALRWGWSEWDGKYLLAFGEFAPENYRGERFTIEWGDGSHNEIVFDCYVVWSGSTPDVCRSLTIDGEPVESIPGNDWRITIEK